MEAAKRIVTGKGGYEEAMADGVEGRDGVVGCDGGTDDDRSRPRDGAIVLMFRQASTIALEVQAWEESWDVVFYRRWI